MPLKSEQISFYTHFGALLVSIAGTVFLVLRFSGHRGLQLMSAIYGMALMFLFAASSLYHLKKRRENDRSIWRKIDHFAIFVMIAGSYTPLCYQYLDGAFFVALISVQWGLVALGAAFKFRFLHAPRIISTLIYLAMGWMALIPMKQFFLGMHRSVFTLMILEGVAYTGGAVLYALKKPVIKPGFFGFHEIFHICVIFGAAFHYFAVFFSV